MASINDSYEKVLNPINTGSYAGRSAVDTASIYSDPMGFAHQDASKKQQQDLMNQQMAAQQAQVLADLQSQIALASAPAAPAAQQSYQAVVAPAAPPAPTPLAPGRQARLDQYAQRKGLSATDARSAYDTRFGAQPAAAPAAAPTASASSSLPWMGYNQYYAGNEAALHPKAYETQYATEYNNYKDTLPFIYQDLINYGISPEAVASGSATGLARGSSIEKIPTDPALAMALYGNATTAGSIPDARYKPKSV